MSKIILPKRTVDYLNNGAAEGQRHEELKAAAVQMKDAGISRSEAESQLKHRGTMDGLKEREIVPVIDWVYSKAQRSPIVVGSEVVFRPVTTAPPKAKPLSPMEEASWWLNNQTMTADQFKERSQLPIPDSDREALKLFFELLYNGPDNINIVCRHDVIDKKARPIGPGQTLSRDKWIEWITAKGVPASNAGAWVRLNPCKAQGSGSHGAITDSDVTSFRFLLVESDVLPIEMQLAMFARLPVPISAAILSGSSSVHAWVRIDADTAEQYESRVRKILGLLSKFGIDQANKNPSRLSRLPGARRIIGASNGGMQSLLWLNPSKGGVTDKDIEHLENVLLVPAVEEKPFQRLIEEAIPRYEWMIANKDRLGVPTGFGSFDRVSGGLKPGSYTLIAANTGVGKTTLALNIINAALKEKHGVILFSLEMSREDITDMMFALNCRVDRNHFNTGEFTEGDIQSMVNGTAWMKNLPLWVDDDPAITADKLRRRVLSLVAENKVGLAVVDYAQLTLPDGKHDTREQEVAAVALAMRLLGREANIPIVLLSQLNDEGRIRESRKLAFEASTVLRMERDSKDDLNDPNITLFVCKGRKIPSTPIKLHLKAEYCLITERSSISESDIPNSHYPDP